MKRRQLLSGLTGIAGISTAAFGTGAFTSTGVERTVSVDVNDDDDAYLTLDPSAEYSRSTTSGGTLEFYIPGLKTRAGLSGTPEGDGIAPNSTYMFDNLVEVQNMGGDKVIVYTETENLDSSFEDLSLIDSARQTIIDEKQSGTVLDSGESFMCGILIETSDGPLGSYSLSMNINAVSTAD